MHDASAVVNVATRIVTKYANANSIHRNSIILCTNKAVNTSNYTAFELMHWLAY